MKNELKLKKITFPEICLTFLLLFLSCSKDDKNVIIDNVAVQEVQMITALENLHIGESAQLEVTVNPEEATNPKVFWSTTNEVVATVDQKGVVTAKSEGKVKIFAVSMDNPRKSDVLEIQIVRNIL